MSVVLMCLCVTLCVVYEYKVACKGVRVHGGWLGGLSWLGLQFVCGILLFLDDPVADGLLFGDSGPVVG